MVHLIRIVLKVLCFALAVGWLALIFFAQRECSILPSIGHQCHGPEGDIWMLPFFYGILGLPTLIASIIIMVIALMRRMPIRSK
jgi:hypothetical protein